MVLRRSLSTVFNKVVQSRPAQFFIRHSGKIAGALFAVGDGVLLFKDHLQHNRIPNGMEQLSGGMFLLADAFLVAADRKASMKIPAGVANLGGAIALGYAGLGDAGQGAQIFGSAVMGVQALALTFETQFQNLAAKASNSGSRILKTVFNPLAKYPVVATTIADLALSKSALVMAAVAKGDMGLLAGNLMWVAADIGLIANDNNVKKLLKNDVAAPKPPSAPPPSLSPPPQILKLA